MPKVAMISYNTFLQKVANGWVDESLFVIQNETGQRWGELQFAPLPLVGALRRIGEESVTKKVQEHWKQLSEHLPSFDKVVIYVGDRGSEHTIKHAAERKLDPEKTVFVLCDCNLETKEDAINRYGFDRSRRITCECGGYVTMHAMATRFIESRTIDF